MTFAPAPMRLTGATILRNGTLQQRSVAIERGRISKGPLPEVDLTGYYVLPGIVDLFGGTPRASERIPYPTALRALAQEAAAHGVTTGWVTLDWSWEGGTRGPEQALARLEALSQLRATALTDLRALILCETHTPDTQDRLLAAVRKHSVDQVIFANRLEESRTWAEVAPLRLAVRAQNGGLPVEELIAAIRRAEGKRRDVPRYLYELAEAFDTLGVSYGSLGDSDGETREYFSQIGAKICTSPVRRAAAALAHAVGDPVVLDASGLIGVPPVAAPVVRPAMPPAMPGLDARDMIRGKLCDALVSRGSYPSLVQGAFALVSSGITDLATAWAYLSSGPADILRLPDRGRIDYGLRADLAVINRETLVVEATLCGGHITHLTGQAAQRFLGARPSESVAAE